MSRETIIHLWWKGEKHPALKANLAIPYLLTHAAQLVNMHVLMCLLHLIGYVRTDGGGPDWCCCAGCGTFIIHPMFTPGLWAECGTLSYRWPVAETLKVTCYCAHLCTQTTEQDRECMCHSSGKDYITGGRVPVCV